ncbi:MAG: hypothetical protein KIT70_09165 [Anaerolineales bacterium]|nr:MAG: hypothetical protein KIT70_09165 [Anaerolineales bacterium]
MISLAALMWMLVAMFALMGLMRGFGKEVLVTASLILAVFIIAVVLPMLPIPGDDQRQFLVRGGVLVACAVAGYQSQRLQRISDALTKARWRNSLLGLLLGGVNGYLLIGSLLFYLSRFNYPFDFITAPGPELTDLLPYMLPQWLTGLWVYIAIALALFMVLVLFV